MIKIITSLCCLNGHLKVTEKLLLSDATTLVELFSERYLIRIKCSALIDGYVSMKRLSFIRKMEIRNFRDFLFILLKRVNIIGNA